jgi:uncharacterized protein
MRGVRLFLVLVSLLLIVNVVSAEMGHIRLLAVSEGGSSGYVGKVADLYLEIKSGKGRVFLDTYPLTKFDTQISTRFAKQIACDFLDADCSDYDFIYTIKSDSGIIGGPSAGGATAVLTTAMLKALPLREDVAMTGTINSGGLIGPVSGLINKIEAAAGAGMKIVLIPKGTRMVPPDEVKQSKPSLFDGSEVDLLEWGKKLNVTVVEVTTISEAMEYFTNVPFRTSERALTVNSEYIQTMKSLYNKLCTRAEGLKSETSGMSLTDSLKQSKTDADKFLETAEKEADEEKYYSATSRCFAANIKYSYIKKMTENNDRSVIIGQAAMLLDKINKSEVALNLRKISTIMDLQAYMVVKERLEEAQISAGKAKSSGSEYDYVYAIERYESADAWSEFFGKRGRTYPMKQSDLKDSCEKKLSEADERIQFVSYYIPNSLQTTREGYDTAKTYADNGEYILCLFKASLAKAEADSLYSTLTVPEDKIDEIITAKLDVTRNLIAKEASLGSFPILAYSYYEYAPQVVSESKYSGLLYAQYALELANLRMYFSQPRSMLTLVLESDYRALTLFWGLIIGVVIGYFYRNYVSQDRRKR